MAGKSARSPKSAISLKSASSALLAGLQAATKTPIGPILKMCTKIGSARAQILCAIARTDRRSSRGDRRLRRVRAVSAYMMLIKIWFDQYA